MDSKDASEVGMHCSVCQTLDFLPFICPACSAPFCKVHADSARPDNHECTASKSSQGDLHSETTGTPAVTFKSLLPDRSKQTSASPAAEELEKKAKKDAALVVLRRNFPSVNTPTASTSSAAGRTAAKPQNKTVALMKLKRSAKPADPRRGEKQVAVADRRYLIVKAAESGRQADVWLPKECSSGKALDLLADLLQCPNRNGVAGVPQSEVLRLVKSTASGEVDLVNSDRLALATVDGDEVHLVRGTS